MITWIEWLSALTESQQREAGIVCFGDRDRAQVLSYFIGSCEGGGEAMLVTNEVVAHSTQLTPDTTDRAISDLLEMGCLRDRSEERPYRVKSGAWCVAVDFAQVSDMIGIELRAPELPPGSLQRLSINYGHLVGRVG